MLNLQTSIVSIQSISDMGLEQSGYREPLLRHYVTRPYGRLHLNVKMLPLNTMASKGGLDISDLVLEEQGSVCPERLRARPSGGGADVFEATLSSGRFLPKSFIK